jgi:hypothetical protein|tara:strand:- start:5777 stop:5944 length:168 start_codon:yes stop_codon:yes gene_type:complete
MDTLDITLVILSILNASMIVLLMIKMTAAFNYKNSKENNLKIAKNIKISSKKHIF